MPMPVSDGSGSRVLALGVLLRSILYPIPKWTPKFAAYFIGTLAAYWTILRVSGF